MPKPSIVFCHGIWADGSCFSKLIPALQADGHEVIAAQYGLDTQRGRCRRHGKRTLGRVSSPAILVGHSYGGSVITAAGTDDRVAGLVYIAALAPDETRPRRANRRSSLSPMCSSTSRSPTGACGCGPTGIVCFAATSRGGAESWSGRPLCAGRRSIQPECPRRGLEVKAQLVHRGQPGPHRSSRPGAVPWRSAWVQPRVRVDSSHVAMLSHPEVVIDVIRAAAASV